MSAAVRTNLLVSRPFLDRDLPGALRLWEMETGWGKLTPAEWRKWYRDTPQGDCMIFVTVDTRGEVVGQIVFVPSYLRIEGKDHLAYRVSTPILARALKEIPFASADHPMRTMFTTGLQAAAMRGAAIAYATPWEKWIPLIRSATKTGSIAHRTAATVLPCLALPRASWKLSAEALAGDLTASRFSEFTDEHSVLWEEFVNRPSIGCSAVRTPESLAFRHGDELGVEIRRTDDARLAGYACIKQQSGLVTELIAIDPDQLCAVIGAVAGWCDRRVRGDCAFDSLQMMECAQLRVLRSVPGIADVDFRFGFFSIALDSSVDAALLDPGRWYLTPGD